MSTILNQGRFTSNGSSQIIQLRSDVDYMHVRNITVATANQTNAVPVEFYWQRGFANGGQWQYLKSNAANAANLSRYVASGGFSLIDSSEQALGQPVAISAITANFPQTVTHAASDLVTGDVIRLFNIQGGRQLSGIDFTVTVRNNTSALLQYGIANLGAAATTGSFRKVPFQPQFYPRARTISDITQASQAVIRMTVTHGFTVGQIVRILVSPEYGMREINNIAARITAVNAGANTITVNVNSSSFTPFAYPASASAVRVSPPQIIPIGISALESESNDLSDATVDTAFIGMRLMGGATSPGGADGHQMYWVAGKSFNVRNT